VEAKHFDAMIRRFAAATSRREALRGVFPLGMTVWLSAVGSERAQARRKKKHKKKQGTPSPSPPSTSPPSPPPPLPSPPPPTCVPNCTGITCGPNGCDGRCDSCSGGRVCNGTACVCPTGTTPCGGNCVPSCGSGTFLDPTECSCCVLNGRGCTSAGTPCCGQPCAGAIATLCAGLNNGAPCDFNAQCDSGQCNAHQCVG
jgi:hypothetical protein